MDQIHISLRWRGPNKSGDDERFSVRADGPPGQLADLIEALAWLASSARRLPNSGISKSDVVITTSRQADVHAMQCSILPNQLEPISLSDLSCWHELFTSAAITNGRGIGTKDQDSGDGLKISLQRMANLAGADYPVDHEGGLMLMGYSSLLVPTAHLSNGALQWHLLTSNDGFQISIWEVQAASRLLITDINDLLNAPSHYLGLWSPGVTILGTSEADYDHFKWTRLEPTKKSISLSSLGLSLGTSGLGIFGANLNANFAINHSHIRCPPSKESLVLMLVDFKTKPILLYNPDDSDRRAFMPPSLVVILHAVHLYAREHELDVVLPFAEITTDSGKAAFDVIKKNADLVIEQVGHLEENKLTLGGLVKAICINLRRMEPHPHKLSGMQGYEFGDFATLDTITRLKHSNFSFGAPHDGWKFFMTKLPLLVARGLGEVMLPLNEANSEIPRVPRGKDFLAAPVKSLEWISQREGFELRAGFLSAEWVWHYEHAPFGYCSCMRDWKNRRQLPCNRVQFIVRQGKRALRSPANLSEHLHGIILIGRLDKSDEADQRRDGKASGLAFQTVRQTVMSSADARYVSPAT
jgi:hypothetical protein